MCKNILANLDISDIEGFGNKYLTFIALSRKRQLDL